MNDRCAKDKGAQRGVLVFEFEQNTLTRTDVCLLVDCEFVQAQQHSIPFACLPVIQREMQALRIRNSPDAAPTQLVDTIRRIWQQRSGQRALLNIDSLWQ